jgi:hypothetical protein
LIEVHPPLHRYPATVELGAGSEAQVSNLSDNFFKAPGSDDIVVHQRQVFFGTVQFVYPSDDCADRFRVPLVALQLRHSAETAFPDAAA